MTIRIAAPLRVADLDQSAPTPFDIVPDADALRQIAADLDLNALRKVRFSGQISAEGKRDWLLTGNLGATVVQPCVVTLAPVTTRIETDVRRQYTPDYVDPEGDEVEMPDDDTLEPLTHYIDLGTVLVEALDHVAVHDFGLIHVEDRAMRVMVEIDRHVGHFGIA